MFTLLPKRRALDILFSLFLERIRDLFFLLLVETLMNFCHPRFKTFLESFNVRWEEAHPSRMHRPFKPFFCLQRVTDISKSRDDNIPQAFFECGVGKRKMELLAHLLCKERDRLLP